MSSPLFYGRELSRKTNTTIRTARIQKLLHIGDEAVIYNAAPNARIAELELEYENNTAFCTLLLLYLYLMLS
jgi:hypothetical protein